MFAIDIGEVKKTQTKHMAMSAEVEGHEAKTGLLLHTSLDAKQLPDVDTLTAAQLQDGIDRCTRLLAQPMLLTRHPGREATIRSRLASYTEALSLREVTRPTCSGTRERAFFEPPSEVKCNGSTSNSDVAFQLAMRDKYRHYRPDLEHELRVSLGTLLSEGEIQKRLAEIPNPKTFLMSYEETLTAQKESLKRERKRELERLKRRQEVQMAQEARAVKEDPTLVAEVFGPTAPPQ